MALQYGLKDPPCSTEWIDVLQMHQQICLNSMEPFQGLCVPSKQRLKRKYLSLST